MELRPERALDSRAGLVAGPEIVAEGLDDVIGGHTDVRSPSFQHLRHGAENSGNRAEGRITLLEPADPVEMAEQLVGPVDEVDDHAPALADVAMCLACPPRSGSDLRFLSGRRKNKGLTPSP